MEEVGIYSNMTYLRSLRLQQKKLCFHRQSVGLPACVSLVWQEKPMRRAEAEESFSY